MQLVKFSEEHPDEEACGNCRYFYSKNVDEWGEEGECKDPQKPQGHRYADYNDCDRFWPKIPKTCTYCNEEIVEDTPVFNDDNLPFHHLCLCDSEDG